MMSLARLSWLSLAANSHALLPRYTLLLFVLLHPAQEVFTATRVFDMFNTQVNPLLENLIPKLTV